MSPGISCGSSTSCDTCTIIVGCLWIVSHFQNRPKGKCVELREEGGKSLLNKYQVSHPESCSRLTGALDEYVDDEEHDDDADYDRRLSKFEYIRSFLLKNYNKKDGPGVKNKKSTVVSVQLNITEMMLTESARPKIDIEATVRLLWTDPRLLWGDIRMKDGSNWPDAKKTTLTDHFIPFSQANIWWPKIYAQYSPSCTLRETDPGSSLIDVNIFGMASMNLPVAIVCECKRKLFLWPFDSYECNFPLNLNPRRKKAFVDHWLPFSQSQSNSSEPESENDFMTLKNAIQDPFWTLTSSSVVKSSRSNEQCQDCLFFSFTFQRQHPNFAAFSIICTLLLVITGAGALFLEPGTFKRCKVIVELMMVGVILYFLVRFTKNQPEPLYDFPFILSHYMLTFLMLSISLIATCSLKSASRYHFHFPSSFKPLIGNKNFLSILTLGPLLPKPQWAPEISPPTNTNAPIEIRNDIQIIRYSRRSGAHRVHIPATSPNTNPQGVVPNFCLQPSDNQQENGLRTCSSVPVPESVSVPMSQDNYYGNSNRNRSDFQNIPLNEVDEMTFISESDNSSYDEIGFGFDQKSQWIRLASVFNRCLFLIYVIISLFVLIPTTAYFLIPATQRQFA